MGNKAMNNHKRKVSQFRSVQKHLDGLFNEEDVNMIAKDIMKQIFAQKAQQNEIEAKYMDDEAIQKRKERSNYQRKESIATPNIFGSSDAYLDDEAMKKRKERPNYVRDESIATPDIFGGDKSNVYMDDEAMKKRKERSNYTRKESIATPDLFGDKRR